MSQPTQEELIQSCQGLVRSLASKIRRTLPKHADLDDLIGYGQMGLAEAARDFDPERGVKFSTFAYYRIRGAIYDGLAEMSWSRKGRAPRTAVERDSKYEQMANHVLRLSHQDAPAPTAADAGKEADWLQAVSGRLAVVYLATHHGDPEPDRTPEPVDENAPDPAAALADRELSQKLDCAIERLPWETALLIRLTYFEGLTLREAAEIFGISKSWASRLHARALQQLGRALGTSRPARDSHPAN